MSKSEEHHLEISLKCSYRTLNSLTSRVKRAWIVFHGYGQLTEYFLKKFEILDPETNFILAPQGLSKFYLQDHKRVGATWMTKEDRLTEIDNQQRYLGAVIENELAGFEGELILFGFSQGVATMGRFATFSKIKFDHMVLWAGSFPHDLEKEDLKDWPEDYKISYFSGHDDPYIKEGLIETQEKRMAELTGKEINANFFEGRHEILPELLLQI